jgi:hypothetical protein
MRRVGSTGLAVVLSALGSAAALGATAASTFASAGPPQQSAAAATCDEGSIDKGSYRLTTDAQAMNVLRPREPWWQPYDIWQEPREIGTVNQGALRLAERARELDERNLLADGYLARQYVVLAVDAKQAETAWDRVLENGGAIVWTTSVYDVDPRSFFVVAFDRRGIRMFRFSQLAGQLRTHFGVPEFPLPERTDFWRALGGCLPPNAVADAEFSWAEVRALRATGRGLRFELRDKIEITSDRGNRRVDDTIEMNLHGQAGGFDFRFGMMPFARRPFDLRPVSADPQAFQARVRQMLVRFFDSDGRLGYAKRES